MAEPVLRDVSDTAFWIAHYRARETARADALFNDPYAERLAGERGVRIAHAMPGSRFVEWTVALRTRIIDTFIQNALAGGADIILNLGAGLDARPYRMTLPANVRWIEADYDRIIEYKEHVLANEAPRCRLERVKIDLADRSARQAFLNRPDFQTCKCLVLTEGVVPYLTPADAGVLADDLYSASHVHWWVLDYFSNRALRYRQRSRLHKVMGDVRFQFDPPDWFAFFQQHGWKPKEMRYFVEEGSRLKRIPPLPVPVLLLYALRAPFMSAKARDELRRSAGYALMERLA